MSWDIPLPWVGIPVLLHRYPFTIVLLLFRLVVFFFFFVKRFIEAQLTDHKFHLFPACCSVNFNRYIWLVSTTTTIEIQNVCHHPRCSLMPLCSQAVSWFLAWGAPRTRQSRWLPSCCPFRQPTIQQVETETTILWEESPHSCCWDCLHWSGMLAAFLTPLLIWVLGMLGGQWKMWQVSLSCQPAPSFFHFLFFSFFFLPFWCWGWNPEPRHMLGNPTTSELHHQNHLLSSPSLSLVIIHRCLHSSPL